MEIYASYCIKVKIKYLYFSLKSKKRNLVVIPG